VLLWPLRTDRVNVSAVLSYRSADRQAVVAELHGSVPLDRPQGRKLAYLVSHYPAISHTFIFNEIRRLRTEGFDILTISVNACDRPLSQLPDVEKPDRMGTFYVKPAGPLKALQSLARAIVSHPMGVLRGLLFTIGLGGSLKRFFYFVEALMIGTWMHDRDVKHLHVHFGMAAATTGLLVAKTFPITYSLTFHGPDEFFDVSKFHLAEKVKAARFVCCIGSFARSQVMRVTPPTEWHKLNVVPLGVDLRAFVSTRRRATLPLEILCIGRLVPAKGQHVLVSAVKRLIEEGRAVRLRLLGDGPERRSLEQRISAEGLTGHVILEGAVNQDRIPAFLDKTDIFALASFAEGIPVSLMEAMASEIPCVSTTIAGIPELIRDQVDGLLVPPSDEEALADALRVLVDNPDRRQSLGRAGRLRVIERYNLEKNVKRLAEVYRCHLQ
jgi:colanic acid/amylovoran biosynthesis glycosyltransferase